jgi:hypothetical protein
LPRILLCPLVPFLAIDILCPLGMAERWPCGHQKYIWLLVVWLEVCDPEKGVTEGGALNTLQSEESSPEWLQLSSSLSLFAKSQAGALFRLLKCILWICIEVAASLFR